MASHRFSALASLIEKRYLRESEMNAVGLYSFASRLRFEETVCRSVEELEEAREFEIRAKKNKLVPDISFEKEWKQLFEEAQKRYRETGNSWDRRILSHDRYMNSLRHIDHDSYIKVLQPYRDERESLWAKEVETFSSGYVAALLKQGKREPSRTTVYKKLMGDGLKPYGFEWDGDTSSAQYLVYSKMLKKSIKLQLRLELAPFRKPFGAPSLVVETGELIYPGGTFCLDMNILVPPTEIPVSFDMWFPLYGDFIQMAYYKFCNLQELEALIGIYLALYRIIQPEMDVALEKDLLEINV